MRIVQRSRRKKSKDQIDTIMGLYEYGDTLTIGNCIENVSSIRIIIGGLVLARIKKLHYSFVCAFMGSEKHSKTKISISQLSSRTYK